MVISSINSVWHFSKHFVIFNSLMEISWVIYFCSKLIPTHSGTWPKYVVRTYYVQPYPKDFWGRGDRLCHYFMITRTHWLAIKKHFSHFHFKKVNRDFHFSVTWMQESSTGVLKVVKLDVSPAPWPRLAEPASACLSIPASPSLHLCVPAGSPRKLRAGCCLRGSVGCSRTTCTGSFQTRSRFTWFTYHSDRAPSWTVACLLHKGVRFLSFKKRSFFYFEFESEWRAEACCSFRLFKSFCLSEGNFRPCGCHRPGSEVRPSCGSTLSLLSSHQALSALCLFEATGRLCEGCLVRDISLVGSGVIASWKTRHYCSFFPSY